MPSQPPRVAVVLSGCGVFDGTEIHEAVCILLALSRAGAEASCFAPDIPVRQVIDHVTSEPAEGESRNVMTESARISRGHISPLAELRAADVDAVVFPGGFGAATNLCTFATDGAACSVLPEVSRVIHEFHRARKPIGMCCIAPVIAARVFGEADISCTLTLGAESDASAAARQMGATHQSAPVTEAVTDAENLLVTTPAYMYHAPIHEIETGISRMITGVLSLVAEAAPA